MSLIELIDIKKSFGTSENKQEILKGININIEKGDLVAIVGPSGSGKSTLLNILGTIDKPTSGKYLLEGQDISNISERGLSEIRNKKIGFVFQSFNLLMNKTVVENILMPLKFTRRKITNKKEKVNHLMERLNIKYLEKKKPNVLSGGEQQRVAIARALINDAEIILADEPTGALDNKNSEEVMNILSSLSKDGITVVIITHDENIAAKCKKRIRIIDGNISNN